MDQHEEIFNISVEMNPGLEPLTMTIFVYHDAALNTELENSFKVTRYKEKLGVITRDTNYCWKQIEGDMDQDKVAAIGAAIDAYYA